MLRRIKNRCQSIRLIERCLLQWKYSTPRKANFRDSYLSFADASTFSRLPYSHNADLKNQTGHNHEVATPELHK